MPTKLTFTLQYIWAKIWRLETLLDLTMLFALYASLQHVSYAFSTVNGNIWWQALIVAIAIDGGLIALARGIARQRTKGLPQWPLWLGVVIFGIVTTYANWFSGTIHQSAVDVSKFEQYHSSVYTLVTYRSILLAAVLPILIFYITEIRASIETMHLRIKRPAIARPTLTLHEMYDYFTQAGLSFEETASKIGVSRSYLKSIVDA